MIPDYIHFTNTLFNRSKMTNVEKKTHLIHEIINALSPSLNYLHLADTCIYNRFIYIRCCYARLPYRRYKALAFGKFFL